LNREGKDRKYNPCDRGCDQEEKPQLDNSAPLSSQGIAYNAPHASQVRRLAVEYSVVRRRMSLMNEVDDSTEQNDGSRENDSCAKKIAYDGFDLLIAPAAWFVIHFKVSP